MFDKKILSSLGLHPLPIGGVRSQIGHAMYSDASHIFPWNRSITGPGAQQTLDWIGQQVPGLEITEFPTGTEIFDWTVPKEWALEDAWLEGPDGNRVLDIKDTNLHVLNYSTPVDTIIDRVELENHLYSLPDVPDAIPYVTSYYQERWGFCLTHNQREALPDGNYRAVIKGSLEPGNLKIGEIVIPGETSSEILLSTYICHPSMANNEVSGMVVTTMLARWLESMKPLRHTYRILFCPETIGAIAFLSKRYEMLRQKLVAGFVITMIGDDRKYSYTQTPNANTLTDRIANHVIHQLTSHPDICSFTNRASDERQFCSPGINLPVVTLMRSGRYPEYHTSADDLGLISPVGLYGGFEFARLCIAALEANITPEWVVKCEPHLSKHGLRNTIGGPRKLPTNELLISHLLAYSDGERDLLAIAEIVNLPIWEVAEGFRQLQAANLLKIKNTQTGNQG